MKIVPIYMSYKPSLTFEDPVLFVGVTVTEFPKSNLMKIFIFNQKVSYNYPRGILGILSY